MCNDSVLVLSLISSNFNELMKILVVFISVFERKK